MNIRLLKNQDIEALEEYLHPYKTECMVICSNLKAAGINYKGADFEGEYFGYFDKNDPRLERLLGFVVHYWNGSIIMHAADHDVLENLILHLKNNISRPIANISGPSVQVEHVIKTLGISEYRFNMNNNQGLYGIKLDSLREVSIGINMDVVSATEISRHVLISWMKGYNIEALGAPNNNDIDAQIESDLNRRIKKNDSWVLLSGGTPVAFSAFNARLTDIVQVGPVWTPPEHRNNGFARLLVSYTLQEEKLKGTKEAVLFAHNPAAMKAYLAIGFKQMGNYRLAILEKPIRFPRKEL